MHDPAAESRPVREVEHVWIPMPDGVRLSARIWLPVGVEAEPVPAVLEYLPYRKDDATAAADATRHPYFAARGYAGVRVDLRGTGDSEGVCLGEYLAIEQDDALEVLAWLAAQPWCTGDCAMIGYSWGGFNGLQVAARRPPQLKAVVTIYSTDDRYTDDCHYQGGCLLGSDMLKWAEWMHAFNATPPDPRFVGEAWRERWLERLHATPPFIGDWISHQCYDAFWKHGSVAEEYSAIRAATLVVGGWADAYTNAVPRLLEHLECPRRGIIGPWGHAVPSRGVPGPAIGFLQECVRWFDRWLKGVDNGADREPLLRAWMQESVAPAGFLAERPGRWIAEEAWPPASVAPVEWVFGASGELGPAAGDAQPTALSIRGDQTCGASAGVWCANGMPDELPLDQRDDDALSLCFDSEPLPEALELLGSPVVRLALSVDQPLALVAARLCEVAPDGTSALVTWGELNLTHRDSHTEPSQLEPGRTYEVSLALNVIGQRIPAGHRLRLALSPTYWPHAWPSPEPVTLTVLAGGRSVLELPVRDGRADTAGSPSFAEPQESAPLVGRVVTESARRRDTSRDPETGNLTIEDHQCVRARIEATATEYAESGIDRWFVAPNDPLSARAECDREVTIERAGWSARVVATSAMSSDTERFIVETALSAFDGDEMIYSDRRLFEVPRDLV